MCLQRYQPTLWWPLAFVRFSVFSILPWVNKPSITQRWQNLNVNITTGIGIDVKNNNKPIYFPFCCHLWRARPPRLHFLSEWSFLLVLCPSWIMDYLSAISQCNHIQQCSSSCAACFRDDASLNFLCAPSELSLHGIAVSSIDLQLFPLLLFHIICWGLCEYSWPEICILKLKYRCCGKGV